MQNFVRMTSSTPLVVCALLLSVPLMGCGAGAVDGPPREAVSGKVTLDGKPLEQGAIQFLPASQAEGVSAGAVIAGGSYSIERDNGLVAGRYRVTINSAIGGAPASPDEPPGAVVEANLPKELLPAKYNTKSELVAEIKAGGPNNLDYELKSK